MSNRALQADLVERFHISQTEAKKLIDEAEAKAAIRTAVARASRGGIVEAKPDADFEQPGAWRHEVHRRLAALDVMEEGVKCLEQLQKHIKSVIESEKQLLQSKRAKVNNKQVDWWDLRDSGWAMGGRERFATYVGDIFRNLDEGSLGGRVMDRMGFKRSIPLPDIPEPVEPVPMDAEQLEASLVRGANQVMAADDWLSHRRYDDILNLAAKNFTDKRVKDFLTDGINIKFWMKRIRKLMDMAAKHPKFEDASDDEVNEQIATVIGLEAAEGILHSAKKRRK